MKPRRQPRLNKQALFEDLGYEPHPGQAEIHSSAHPRRVVACGVRWGKTRCAAMEGVAAAMQPSEHSVGWVVAPTYELTDRVFREMQLVVTTHLRHRIVLMRESDRRLVLRNLAGGTSEIRGKSADNPVSLLGEGLDWVIVDEASRLKPTIWESHLSQRLLDRRGWALLISTPKGKGYFYDLFRRGQGRDPDFKSWNYASWTNPLLDKEVIEEERKRLPERVFKQEYGAEFLEGSGAVFHNVRDVATGDWQEPVAGQRYHAGLALAKLEDFTVLCVLNREREVQFVDRFHRIDWTMQVNRVLGTTNRFNRSKVLVDSTGAGEPIFETLRKAGVYAEAYTFTPKSKDALINNLSLCFEQRQVTLPKPELWPEGIDELEAFEYSVTDSGNVRTSAPYGMHDDCVIALALAAWPLRPSKPRYITITGDTY
ncbi:MAG: phage terminase large subunit family protein [Planctomycetota bacterium]